MIFVSGPTASDGSSFSGPRNATRAPMMPTAPCGMAASAWSAGPDGSPAAVTTSEVLRMTMSMDTPPSRHAGDLHPALFRHLGRALVARVGVPEHAHPRVRGEHPRDPPRRRLR